MKKFNSNLMKDCLTRDEMRSISGGSGAGDCLDYVVCTTHSDCHNAACDRCGTPASAAGEKACGTF